MSGTADAIIPMGVLIKGDTYHFEVIADTVTSALMSVGLQTSIPVIFGVLTVNTEEQAKDRSTCSNNHGSQWGKAAVEMATLRERNRQEGQEELLRFWRGRRRRQPRAAAWRRARSASRAATVGGRHAAARFRDGRMRGVWGPVCRPRCIFWRAAATMRIERG